MAPTGNGCNKKSTCICSGVGSSFGFVDQESTVKTGFSARQVVTSRPNILGWVQASISIMDLSGFRRV